MSGSVIDRLSTSALYQGYGDSEIQRKTDDLVSRFVQEACDEKALLPLMAGGLAYRFGRMGVMGVGASVVRGPWSVVHGPLSVMVGLGSEVIAYEFTNRTLQTFAGGGTTPLQNVSRFPFSIPHLWSWSGPDGWQQGLLHSAFTFGLLKGAGFLARDQNLILQHSFQATAMVAGHQTAGLLKLAQHPEGSLAEQILYAEVMNLQMSAGFALLHSLAPHFSAFEKALDLKINGKSKPILDQTSPFPLQKLLLSAYGGTFRPETKPKLDWNSPLFMMKGDREGLLPTAEEAGHLQTKYRGHFPSDFLPRSRQSAIVMKAALETPCGQALFHERLLEAYALSPNKGSIEQTYTALAIQDLFTFSDPNSNTGSFQNTIHQILIRRIMGDADSGRRLSAFSQLSQAMEQGLHLDDLVEIFNSHGYGDDLKASPSPQYPRRFTANFDSFLKNYWRHFPASDQILLLNAIYELSHEGGPLAAQMLMQTAHVRNQKRYPLPLIDQVLTEARTHPLGRVMVRRMIQVFRAEDLEAKLREMLPEGPKPPRSFIDRFRSLPVSKQNPSLRSILEKWSGSLFGVLFLRRPSSPAPLFESLETIHELSSQGLSKDEIAQNINGTRHTAYLNDLRLARKIVTIYLNVYPQIRNGSSVREERRKDFEKLALKIKKDLTSQPSRDDYLNLIHSLEFKLPDWLMKNIKAGELKIEVLDDRKFEGEDYGLSGAKDHLARFVKGNTEKGISHLIQIREIPSHVLNSDSKMARVKALADRLFALVHEIGHYKIWTGLDEEIQEYPEGPLPMAHRHQVLASEIIANLEEQPLRTRYWEIEPWLIASRLGETLTQYVRLTNEHLYYRRVNEQLMEGLKPLP